MSSSSDLEESISDFFSKAGACTLRRQCDAFANKILGGPITPVPVQGTCSYTVTNGTTIIQFREPASPLDLHTLAAVHAAHPGIVANHSFHGTIGESPALHVYSMNILPGDNYFDLSLSLTDDDSDHRLQTVRSLARFFAQAWQKGSRPSPKSGSATLEDYLFSFASLRRNFPSRFQNPITQVMDHFPALFSGAYPMVPTHGDLSERNILADPATGAITGIIDWAEVGVLPFGFALYGLDSVLGYLTPSGWVFHDAADGLREDFWRVFGGAVGGVPRSEMELIQLARWAGLFLRYGLSYKPGRKGVVGVGGDDVSFKALTGLVLAERGLSQRRVFTTWRSRFLFTDVGWASADSMESKAVVEEDYELPYGKHNRRRLRSYPPPHPLQKQAQNVLAATPALPPDKEHSASRRQMILPMPRCLLDLSLPREENAVRQRLNLGEYVGLSRF